MAFDEKYRLTNDLLGKGQYGKVWRCVKNDDGENHAVKIILTKNMKRKDFTAVHRESKIGLQLRHKNVVQMHDSYFHPSKYYLVFDLIVGGELFDDIVRRDHYSEENASKMIKQVMEAMKFCHGLGIVHRDLKPENILLSDKGPNATIKIADFGLAVEMSEPKAKMGLTGTPMYIAPEILSGKAYGYAVDMWSIGCILYIMLVGYPAFWAETQTELYTSIILGEYTIERSPEWDSISTQVKDLLRKLFDSNDDTRITACQALKHEWITDNKVAPKIHRQSTLEEMQSFNAKRKLKAAMTAVMTANRLSRNVG